MLFSIETNLNFDLVPSEITPELTGALSKYEISDIKESYSVKKRNVDSQIFKISTASAEYILRSVDVSLASSTEQQCRLLNNISFQNIIKPVKNILNTYTLRLNDKIWMLYPFFKGSTFSVQLNAQQIISMAIELNQSIDAHVEDNPTHKYDDLPIIAFDNDPWDNFFDCLTKKTSKVKVPSNYLTEYTKNLLCENRDYILRSLERLKDLNIKDNVGITHYDLQHANILVHNGSVCFIDIEDVYYANRELAISYAVLKLLRHLVYLKKKTPIQTQNEELTNIVTLLKTNFGLLSPADILKFGLYRLFGELWGIYDFTQKNNDQRYLYDFEKKVHHIFEYSILMGEDNGLIIK